MDELKNITKGSAKDSNEGIRPENMSNAGTSETSNAGVKSISENKTTSQQAQVSNLKSGMAANKDNK